MQVSIIQKYSYVGHYVDDANLEFFQQKNCEI